MNQEKLSLEDAAEEYASFNGHSGAMCMDETTVKLFAFTAGAKFREAQLIEIVNEMKTEIERVSDESTHGDNCRFIIYQGIRNCDCHKPEIKQLLTNVNKALDEMGIK